MQWDLEQISQVLNARIEEIGDQSENQYLLWFSDLGFKFYLHIQPASGTVILAADPVEPTGMPLFEYSFNCKLIKIIDSPYYQNTKAIYFYENCDSDDGVRLAMNLRNDGRWYLWCNTWQRGSRLG